MTDAGEQGLDHRSHDELLVELEAELQSLAGARDSFLPLEPFDESARGQQLRATAAKWTTVTDLVKGHLRDHEEPVLALVGDEDCFETAAIAVGVLNDVETWLRMAGAPSAELEAKRRRIARLAAALWDSQAWNGTRSVVRTELARSLQAVARPTKG
jgi:hypothetical protein